MSYSISTKSVTMIQDKLDLLLTAYNEGKSEIAWHTNDPNKLAYQLRQAFKTVEKKPNTFAKYVEIVDKYKIAVKPQKVVAERRTPIAEVAEVSVKEFVQQVERFVVNEAFNLMHVVGAAVTHKNYKELYFPNAELNVSDLTKLYRVSSNLGYKIIKGEGLTLTKMECGDLEWKPTVSP